MSWQKITTTFSVKITDISFNRKTLLVQCTIQYIVLLNLVLNSLKCAVYKKRRTLYLMMQCAQLDLDQLSN